jgi:hypothetical protein
MNKFKARQLVNIIEECSTFIPSPLAESVVSQELSTMDPSATNNNAEFFQQMFQFFNSPQFKNCMQGLFYCVYYLCCLCCLYCCIMLFVCVCLFL